jgi:hypothetical protein
LSSRFFGAFGVTHTLAERPHASVFPGVLKVTAQSSSAQSELQQTGLSVSLRGDGRAAFLLVEHDGKAVEISDHEGQWWVEFWDASDDEDAAPATDQFFPTLDQAVDATTCWLLKGSQCATSAQSQPTAKPGCDPS